jgi:tRNA(Ile)-lysidine synthase
MPRRPPAVARVLERVTATAREHDMFTPGDRVLVAVSGGPDSTCLLHSLWMLRRLFKIHLEVFHFDHRLRPDSAKDAAYVKRTAAKLKLPFHLRESDSTPGKGESVEMWARVQRWNAANAIRREQGFASVALGHTLDDQAETLIIALLRGGGIHFVSGMAPREDHTKVRPLLEVRRSEVESFVRGLGLRPRLDPTNLDTRLLRNAVRLRVIPQMEESTGRDVKGTLARTARLLREDRDELLTEAARHWERLGRREEGGVRIRAKGLSELSVPIGGRVVQMAMWQTGVHPERQTVRAILDLATGRPGRRVSLPGGFTAVREREYIRISSPENP